LQDVADRIIGIIDEQIAGASVGPGHGVGLTIDAGSIVHTNRQSLWARIASRREQAKATEVASEEFEMSTVVFLIAAWAKGMSTTRNEKFSSRPDADRAPSPRRTRPTPEGSAWSTHRAIRAVAHVAPTRAPCRSNPIRRATLRLHEGSVAIASMRFPPEQQAPCSHDVDVRDTEVARRIAVAIGSHDQVPDARQYDPEIGPRKKKELQRMQTPLKTQSVYAKQSIYAYGI
jgi:hypothetical protein